MALLRNCVLSGVQVIGKSTNSDGTSRGVASGLRRASGDAWPVGGLSGDDMLREGHDSGGLVHGERLRRLTEESSGLSPSKHAPPTKKSLSIEIPFKLGDSSNSTDGDTKGLRGGVFIVARAASTSDCDGDADGLRQLRIVASQWSTIGIPTNPPLISSVGVRGRAKSSTKLRRSWRRPLSSPSAA